MFFCRARTFIWLLGALSLCLEIYGAEPMQSRFSLVSVSRADVLFENASDPFFCEIPGGASLFSAAGDVSFSSWKLNWGAASFLSSSGEQLVSVDEFLISRIFGSVEISAGRTGYPARVADPARWLSGSFEPDELFSPVLIRSDRFELFRVSNRTSVCDFEAVFLPFSPRFASPVYNDPLFNRHGIDTKVSLIDSTYELRFGTVSIRTGVFRLGDCARRSVFHCFFRIRRTRPYPRASFQILPHRLSFQYVLFG